MYNRRRYYFDIVSCDARLRSNRSRGDLLALRRDNKLREEVGLSYRVARTPFDNRIERIFPISSLADRWGYFDF